MVMTGHAQRLAQPLTRGQRRAIAVVVAALVGISAWLIVGGAASSAFWAPS